METIFPALSDSALTSIVSDIDRKGFGVAENCIREEDISTLRRFIEDRVANAGGEYVAFTGIDSLRGTLLERLAASPEFKKACRYIYEKGSGKSVPETPPYQVLRCLSGKGAQQHSFIFHYDSYVLTALLPIVMPSEGLRGDLIMLPNTRKIRRTYFGNLIDKILLDNKITQKALKWLITTGRLKATKVHMNPGSIYFFWGCRSIHANEPCDPDKIRATALFHYVDPHNDSWLKRKLRGDGPAKH